MVLLFDLSCTRVSTQPAEEEALVWNVKENISSKLIQFASLREADMNSNERRISISPFNCSDNFELNES